MVSSSSQNTRFFIVDFLRSLAIVLMIIFHFCYDLNYFNLVTIDFFHNPFWFGLPRLIVFLFFLCVGMSLYIVHAPKKRPRHLKRKALKLLLASLTISLISYLFSPEQFIYFGTLHCILVASVLGYFLVPKPKWALVTSLFIFILHIFFLYKDFNYKLLPIGEFLGVEGLDYIPLFPWFGVVAFGIYLGDRGIPEKMTCLRMRRLFPQLDQISAILSRYSFAIYLGHQIILFALAYLISLCHSSLL